MAGKTLYSGKDIIRAGEKLTDPSVLKNSHEFSNAMDVLSYWRQTFEQPLESAFELVEREAAAKDKTVICAKRLKRHVSIVNKLQRFDKMKLRNMQDIGGCRAIVSSLSKLRKVESELIKHPEFKLQNGQPKVKDYIAQPKEDGYRSVHLIGKFQDQQSNSKYIEVQLRTVVQHYWATALEIVDLFTQQSLKTNQGQDVWKSFFQDAGVLFEIIDNIHMFSQLDRKTQFNLLYQQIIENPDQQQKAKILECCARVVNCCKELQIIDKLEAYTGSLKVMDERLNDARLRGFVLLQINLSKKQISAQVINEKNPQAASSLYVQAEKNAALVDDLVVAMVYTNAVGGIKSAYPNYFADSTEFIQYLNYIRRIYQLFTDNQRFATHRLKSIVTIRAK